jgi:queuine/archaeosine tRNA-ribosyltransferase
MVPLKTEQILRCLDACAEARASRVQFHLLGVTRHEFVPAFAGFGVTSFDSTSPFRQAFKDDRDNFYALERAYSALRVPQVEGNTRLEARIRAAN